MVVDTDGAAAHACAHATHANANARTAAADAVPYSNSKHTEINKRQIQTAHTKSYTKIAATATSVVVVPSLLSSAFFCTCLCILF